MHHSLLYAPRKRAIMSAGVALPADH